MKNQVQNGDAINVPAPIGGVVSGQLVVVGILYGVAGIDAAAGVIVPLSNKGVFSLPKKSTETWSNGEAIYWDPGNQWCSHASGSGFTKIGAATPLAPGFTAAAGNGATVGDVRLNPSF